MPYPELAEVETATSLQLARWSRHLDSPGLHAAGRPDFEAVFAKEKAVAERVAERFHEAGGWTPSLSKAVGW